jgi:hypothetical protein
MAGQIVSGRTVGQEMQRRFGTGLLRSKRLNYV